MGRLNKNKVREMLEKFPPLRDNDTRLLINIWARELMELGYDPKRLADFFALLLNNDLSNAETIRRSRQKLQEDYPELRGNSYNERKKKIDEWKEELGYVTKQN
jgi:hypothetical protein